MANDYFYTLTLARHPLVPDATRTPADSIFGRGETISEAIRELLAAANERVVATKDSSRRVIAERAELHLALKDAWDLAKSPEESEA